MATPTTPEEQENAQDTQPGPAGTEIFTTEEGNQQVISGTADYGSLVAPFVDFQSIFDFASTLGQENRATFFRNLADSRQAALGLLNTDVEGIQQSANILAPFVRGQGDIDTQKNIERAGRLDQFNFDRLGRFNQFNLSQQAQTQSQRQRLRDESLAGSGLNFRGRVTRLLDDLEAQTQGRLPAGLEADFLRDTRNRGSEIGAATGISPLSSAGARASDRLLVGERIGISQRAQQLFPSVLGQAQNALQAPEQQAPTLFAQPTQVPLNVSNVADRIPVQSSISAGAAQQAIGSQATAIETIPATTALGARLQTEQFNEQSRFTTDLTKLDAEQAHINAVDNAVQAGINADKGDELREQQNQAFNRALDLRERSERLGAVSNIIGSFLGSSASTPDGEQSLGGQIVEGLTKGIGGIIDAGAGFYDSTFGDGDGKLTVGDTEISGASFGKFVDDIGDFFGAKPAATQQAQAPEGTPAQRGGLVPADKPRTEADTASTFKKLSEPAPGDTQTLIKAGLTAANFNNLSGPQQLQAVNNLGTEYLTNRGIITPQQAQSYRRIGDGVATLLNSDASGADKTRALTTLAAEHFEIPYEGDIRAPTSINGRAVVRDFEDPETGARSFATLDENGNQVITSQQDLVNSSNVVNGLQAISVLTSDADDENKILALTSLGVDSATANGILTQTQGGNLSAALGLISTAVNWNDMSPVQQGISLMRVGLNTAQSIQALSTGQGLANTGLSFLAPEAAGQVGTQVAGQTAAQAGGTAAAEGGTAAAGSGALGTAALWGGAALGVATGIYTAAQTSEVIRESARSRGPERGAAGFAAAGASIGAAAGAVIGTYFLPVVGTYAGSAIGAVVGAVDGAKVGWLLGHTGSGKSTEQQERESWRDSLVKSGFGEKDEGGRVFVTLADGTKANISAGADLGGKDKDRLVNTDGSLRHNFDIDWGNEAATSSIPEAHLFAIASGLNPTETNKLFHQAVGQSINAATSNADTPEAVQANIKAMLGDKVNPQQLASNIELLRLKNQITEEEYGVYLDRTNKLLGTEFQPSDREEARQAFIDVIGDSDNDLDKKALRQLTDPKWQEKSLKKLNKRLGKEADNLEKEVKTLPAPGQTRGSVAGAPRDPGRGAGEQAATQAAVGSFQPGQMPVTGQFPEGPLEVPALPDRTPEQQALIEQQLANLGLQGGQGASIPGQLTPEEQATIQNAFDSLGPSVGGAQNLTPEQRQVVTSGLESIRNSVEGLQGGVSNEAAASGIRDAVTAMQNSGIPQEQIAALIQAMIQNNPLGVRNPRDPGRGAGSLANIPFADQVLGPFLSSLLGGSGGTSRRAETSGRIGVNRRRGRANLPSQGTLTRAQADALINSGTFTPDFADQRMLDILRDNPDLFRDF